MVPRRVGWLWLEEDLRSGEGVTEEIFSEQVSLETKGCSCWWKDKSIHRCENLWHFGDTSNTTCGKTLPLFYSVMWWRVTVCVCVVLGGGGGGGGTGSAEKAGNEAVEES